MDQAGSSPKPNILVAPLDWGLGHATRCIPVIRELVRQDCRVHLAGDGKVKALLTQEFPHLPFVDLKGYGVNYSASRWTLPFTLTAQIPKIIAAIKYENERLKIIVKEQSIDAVISDNRYGLYHPGIPTVFLTHQLLIKTPLGKYADRQLQKINYSYINQFTECWVPDNDHGTNFAGDLSHPLLEPGPPVRYLGPLSRFSPTTHPLPGKHLLVLLSGPEPQRTLLENIFVRQAGDYRHPTVFVRGLPGGGPPLSLPAHVTVHDHLAADALEEAMSFAHFVVARCGYSTVMDLAVLQKKGILIPTPGQTEQQYLSEHLMRQRTAFCIAQERFRLRAALELASSFDYQFPDLTHSSHLQSAVKSLLYKIEFRKS